MRDLNTHLLVNPEWGVCAFTSERQSSPAKEEEGILAVSAYALRKSCTWVLLKAAPCLRQPAEPVVSVSSVRARVGVGDPHSPSLLAEATHGKAAATSLSPGQRPPAPCTAGSFKPQGCWRWWAWITPLNIQHKSNLETAFALRNVLWDSSASTHRELILLVPNARALPLFNHCLDIN